MDTEFPPLPGVDTSQALIPFVPQGQAPSVGKDVTQLFMDCAPISWRFDVAGVSADDSGPLEIRVYCSRQRTLLTSQGQRSPFLSFFLPFTGKEDWSEDSVLAFTCTEIW